MLPRVLAVLALAVLAAPTARAQPRPAPVVERFEWLGRAGGTLAETQRVTDVNESGVVAATTFGRFDGIRSYLSSGNALLEVSDPRFERPISINGLNDAREVSGTFEFRSSGDGRPAQQAFRRSLGTRAPHGILEQTRGAAINEDGVSTGQYIDGRSPTGVTRAYRWTDTSFVLLNQIPLNSRGTDINDVGEIVVSTIDDDQAGTNRMWIVAPNGAVTQLPDIGFIYPFPEAINNSGHVAGLVCNDDCTFERGFLWDGVRYTLLQMPPGHVYSKADDLNDADQVVGNSYLCTSTRCHWALVWQDGVTYTLEDLAAPFLSTGSTLFEASAIANAGWIAGTGFNAATNRFEFYRMQIGDGLVDSFVHDVTRFGRPGPALAGVTVSVGVGGAVEATTTTDATGHFEFDAPDLDPALLYDLTLESSALGEGRAYAALRLTELSDTTAVLPAELHRRLGVELSQLEETGTLVLSYNVEAAEALVPLWNTLLPETADTHRQRDRSLGRFLTAAEAMDDLYANVEPLAEETASVTVSAVTAALAVKKLVGELREAAEGAITRGVAQGTVAATEAPLAFAFILKGLEIGVGFLQDKLTSAISGALPEQAAAVFDGAAGLATTGVTAALESGAWDSGAGRRAVLGSVVETLVGQVAKTVVTSGYVAATQGELDLAAARARALNGSGEVQPAFAATQALVAATTERNDFALNVSTAISATTDGWGTVADVSMLVGRIPAAQIAAVAGGVIRALSAGTLVGAMVNDYYALYRTAEEDVPRIVGQAFGTGGGGGGGSALAAGAGQRGGDCGGGGGRGNLGPGSTLYTGLLGAVRDRVAGGDRPGALEAAADLLAADDTLAADVEASLLPLVAVAPAVLAQGTCFEVPFRDAVAAAARVAAGRVELYAALSGYVAAPLAADPDGPTPGVPDGPLAAADSVLVRAPRLAADIAAFETAIAAATEAAGGVQAPPYVLVASHGPTAEPVVTDSTFTLCARVVNGGGAAAEGVVVALVAQGDTLGGPPPPLHVLSAAAQDVGTLAPGEARVLTWEVAAADTSGTDAGTAGRYDVTVTALSGRVQGARGTVEVVVARAAAPPLVLTGTDGWRMLAPAYTDQIYGDLVGPLWTQGFPGADAPVGAPTVYRYDETAPTGGFTPLAAQTAAAPPGRGLFAYVYADDDFTRPGTQGGFPKTVVQFGEAFAGPAGAALPVSFSPTGTANDDGWNLAGNPFATGMDWDAAGWTRTAVSDALYVWDPNAAGGPQYLTWSAGVGGSLGSGVLAPNQGFWTKAMGPSPVLTAPLAARVGGGTFHGRGGGGGAGGTSDSTAVLALRVEGVVGGAARAATVHVAFADGALDGLDRHDAYELAPPGGAALLLYARSGEGDALDIDVRGLPPGERVEVALGAQVRSPDAAPVSLTLSWPDVDRLPAAWSVSLEDRETGAVVDLREAASYTFEVVPDSAAAREAGPPAPAPLGRSTPGAVRGPANGRLVVVVRPGTATSADAASPTALALGAPRPNPTSGAAVVPFSLPATSRVRLAVYDVLGREVAVLADGERPAGRHEAPLDATRLAAGLYVVRLTAGDAVQTRRLTVAR